MSVDDEVRVGLRRREGQLTAFSGRVLVFGPGDEIGKTKRRTLIKRLRRRGFEAWTPEQLSRRMPSFLNAYQQEDVHWRLFDIILIFDFGYGVGQEVAGFVHDPEFRKMAYVMFPPEYDPVVSGSFGSELLRLYPNKRPVSGDEWQVCTASKLGFDYVVSKRTLEYDLTQSGR